MALILAILAVASINIFLMHYSVPDSLKNQYPQLKKTGNILYYSFMPFLVVLPFASFIPALLLALLPVRHYRYTQKLWIVFLGILFILELVSLTALMAKYQ